jgi:hypothetical protein
MAGVAAKAAVPKSAKEGSEMIKSDFTGSSIGLPV